MVYAGMQIDEVSLHIVPGAARFYEQLSAVDQFKWVSDKGFFKAYETDEIPDFDQFQVDNIKINPNTTRKVELHGVMNLDHFDSTLMRIFETLSQRIGTLALLFLRAHKSGGGGGFGRHSASDRPTVKFNEVLARVQEEYRKMHERVHKRSFNDLFRDLVTKGVHEEDAHIMIANLSEYELRDPFRLHSKNHIYFVRNRETREPRIVKMVKDTDSLEARAEACFGFRGSRNRDLRPHVARVDHEEPHVYSIGWQPKHVIIQEDITDKINQRAEWVLRNGNKRQLYTLVDEWMKIFAKINVIGADVMHDTSFTAKPYLHDGSMERVDQFGVAHDSGFVDEYRISGIEEGIDYINGDLDPIRDIKGQYVLDWGHSGFGNGVKEVVRFLQHPLIQRHGEFDATTVRHFLETYLGAACDLRERDVTARDLRDAVHAYDSISQANALARVAYLRSCEDKLAQPEKEHLVYVEHTHLSGGRVSETRDTIIYNLVR